MVRGHLGLELLSMGLESHLVLLHRMLAVEEVARVPRQHAAVGLGARQRLLGKGVVAVVRGW